VNRLLVLLAACGSSSPATPIDAPNDASDLDARPSDAGACTTRITYGAAWLAPAGHAAQFDDVAGPVTWDGACHADGANSYALLSNGFKPYFKGASACAIALDGGPRPAGSGAGGRRGGIDGGPRPAGSGAGGRGGGIDGCASAACATRISYGDGWQAPPNHADLFDDVAGRVFGDGTCIAADHANLSNGFQPHFSGGSCPLSFRYTGCGGLYANPVIAQDAPDPGVLLVGGTYYLAHTGSNFPLFTSPDLVSWTAHGHIFAAHPSWAKSDFWAPEIHAIGDHYVAYYSARGADGKLAIGAARADAPNGPFTDLGAPLIHDANMGLIDASEITTAAGSYVLWKEDGNAIGKPTPIHAQKLAADGLSVTGPIATLITNDLAWEGKVTEGPFMVAHGGMYYLFYSGNSYANSTYAVGVARGTSPMGPFTKRGDPIVVSNARWVGPGHCSVVDAPGGETAMVYHAWKAGCVNTAGCGRETLVDLIHWDSDGWPSVPLSPGTTSRPLP